MKIRKMYIRDVIDHLLSKSAAGQKLLELSGRPRSLSASPILSELSPIAGSLSMILYVMIGITGVTWAITFPILVLTHILILIELIIIVFAITLLFGWPWVLIGLWEYLIIASPRWHVITIFLLLVTGCLLYLARTFMRPLYGLAEIFVAGVICWIGFSNTSGSGISAALSIAGGIYILVRGLDNMIVEESLISPYILDTSKNDDGTSTR